MFSLQWTSWEAPRIGESQIHFLGSLRGGVFTCLGSTISSFLWKSWEKVTLFQTTRRRGGISPFPHQDTLLRRGPAQNTRRLGSTLTPVRSAPDSVCDLLGTCPCYQGIQYLSEIPHLWETELNSQESVQTDEIFRWKILQNCELLYLIIELLRVCPLKPRGIH